jgi:teichuronic acid biosynthesis glycosyltransferase TuaC
MKIGLLTTSYPRSRDDIAGDFVRGYARTLASLGHSVEVLVPEPSEATSTLADPSILVRHVPYLRPRTLERTFYGAGVPDNLRRDVLAWPGAATFPLALFGATAKHVGSWDAIVSHWALPSALVAGALRGTRPHVSVMHSADVHLLSRLPLGRRLAERIDAGATRLVFVSHDLRDRFVAVLGREPTKPTEVASMGFEPLPESDESRAAIRRRLDISGSVVLSMGRLVPIKGIDVLLRAVAMLRGVTLVVAGDGPERGRLESLAGALGVNARFVGTIRDRTKSDWLRASDFFALASRRLEDGRTEGTPVSVLEAMHAGLPVVATDTGGVRAALGAAGRIVPECDPPALAQAIEELRHDEVARATLARAGRGRAEQHAWARRAPVFARMFES